MNADQRPTHLDLFSGIAGLSIAFEREGFQTIGFAEINPYASAILRQRFPGVPNYGDVQNVPVVNPDVITCGDPCQRNSNAWRNGKGVESPAIYGLRVIAANRPRFVLRENPSRVRSDAPWPWWRFRSELEKLGYAVLPVRLRACCFGADHQRERLFLFAELPNTNSQGLQRNVGEIMERANQWRQNAHVTRPAWGNSESRICRVADGIPQRIHRIAALGNAVLPQIPFLLGQAINQIEREQAILNLRDGGE